MFFYPYTWVYQADETPYYSIIGVRSYLIGNVLVDCHPPAPPSAIFQDRGTLRYAQCRIFDNQFGLWEQFAQLSTLQCLLEENLLI